MAKILAFRGAVAEDIPEDTDLSTLALFTKLYHDSRIDLQRITHNFQRYGWTPTAETLMARIAEDLKAISALVAGARNNGPQTEA